MRRGNPSMASAQTPEPVPDIEAVQIYGDRIKSRRGARDVVVAHVT